ATLRDAVAGVAETAPVVDFRTADDAVSHRAWRVSEPSTIEAARRSLATSTAVIADGHHRFRTALEYRNERRAAGDGDGPWDFMLMYLVDAGWCGPALLPIHRILDVPAAEISARLRPVFDVVPAGEADPERLARELAERRNGGR